MKINIWVCNPYSFKYEETRAIQETLRCIYGGDPVYLKEWPDDHVSVDNVNITTARKMADMVKAFHPRIRILATTVRMTTLHFM